MHALACRYFDGRSSRARPASVAIVDDALRLSGDDLERVYPANEIAFSPATGHGPSRIAFAGGGLCEFDDRVAADALFAALGHRPSLAERLGATPVRVAGVAIAFVAALAALYAWGIPAAADAFVDRAPTGFERALGDRELATLDARHVFRPTRLPDARRDAIVERFAALSLPLDRTTPRADVRITFRRLGVPNAFALPGDIVVVSDEIVELADDDDALLVVLAHEAGHIDRHDALRQTVRAALVSIVAAWYLGDVSNAAAVVAGGIGSMRYSRDVEHAADLYAVRAMHANGLPTAGAAELFRRLQAWRPSAAKDATRDATKRGDGRWRLEVPEYLGTHPATDARIRLFETGDETPGAAD